MACRVCNKKSVSEDLCKQHFIEEFEKNIENQIIFDKNNRVLIGLSGGLNSTVLTYVLKKMGYDITCVFIENSSSTKNFVRKFCSKMNLQLFTIVDQSKDVEKVLIKFCENRKFDHIVTGKLISDNEDKNKLYAKLNNLEYES